MSKCTTLVAVGLRHGCEVLLPGPPASRLLQTYNAVTSSRSHQLHNFLTVVARREALGDSALQRRVLLRWCSAARVSRHASRRLATALAARRTSTCRAALHRWHLALLRTRLLRGMGQARSMRTAGRALACLHAYVLHRR